ncbi:ferritin-like domain-containing protein, partial [Salmonella enterica]
FHLDKDAIRAAAKKIDDGAVTEGYRGNREEVVAMLNDALATELLCVMRYKRHYYTAKGLNVEAIKGEFLAHAQEEQSHADQIAER